MSFNADYDAINKRDFGQLCVGRLVDLGVPLNKIESVAVNRGSVVVVVTMTDTAEAATVQDLANQGQVEVQPPGVASPIVGSLTTSAPTPAQTAGTNTGSGGGGGSTVIIAVVIVILIVVVVVGGLLYKRSKNREPTATTPGLAPENAPTYNPAFEPIHHQFNPKSGEMDPRKVSGVLNRRVSLTLQPSDGYVDIADEDRSKGVQNPQYEGPSDLSI